MDGQRHCKGIYNCTFNLIDSCEFYTYIISLCATQIYAVSEPQTTLCANRKSTLCANLKQRCVRPSNNAVCDPQTTLCATLKQRCVRPSNNAVCDPQTTLCATFIFAVCDLHHRCVQPRIHLCISHECFIYQILSNVFMYNP